MLARTLLHIENVSAHKERQRLIDIGRNQTPKTDRQCILSLVEAAWLSLDHRTISEKGYKQTGPNMPLHGPVRPQDVYCDLLKVLEELEATPDPSLVGMLYGKSWELILLKHWTN